MRRQNCKRKECNKNLIGPKAKQFINVQIKWAESSTRPIAGINGGHCGQCPKEAAIVKHLNNRIIELEYIFKAGV